MNTPPPDQEIDSPTLTSDELHDSYSALRGRDFRRFLVGNVLALLGLQMQSYAVGWEIYERTRSSAALGWVGLVQVLPVVGLFLPAGHLVDRMDRRRILLLALSGAVLCSLGLAWNSYTTGPLWFLYLCLVGIGIARAFTQPARVALLMQVVPRSQFSSAVTWNSGGFQLAMVVGPALGGILVARLGGAAAVYLCNAVLAAQFALTLTTIHARPFTPAPEPTTLKSLAAGLAFVWRTKVVFAAITLDMFAVLLGGATAMLPVYAKEILEVDAQRLSWLRAAPGVGALVMSLWLAHRPPLARAGRALLWSVAGFGAATIVFGLSHSFSFSLATLTVLGALDMISVVIRHTLVQLLTPDVMRGRVSAVNGMFIGVSNELGEAESGFVAALFDRGEADRSFGPMVSVVGGGVGTLAVVALVTWLWPQLRRYGRLDGKDSLPVQAGAPQQASLD
ncbi:MAG: MFS transporter [Planctomycetaceae bacterium]